MICPAGFSVIYLGRSWLGGLHWLRLVRVLHCRACTIDVKFSIPNSLHDHDLEEQKMILLCMPHTFQWHFLGTVRFEGLRWLRSSGYFTALTSLQGRDQAKNRYMCLPYLKCRTHLSLKIGNCLLDNDQLLTRQYSTAPHMHDGRPPAICAKGSNSLSPRPWHGRHESSMEKSQKLESFVPPINPVSQLPRCQYMISRTVPDDRLLSCPIMGTVMCRTCNASSRDLHKKRA
jgi:hypothetical protein